MGRYLPFACCALPPLSSFFRIGSWQRTFAGYTPAAFSLVYELSVAPPHFRFAAFLFFLHPAAAQDNLTDAGKASLLQVEDSLRRTADSMYAANIPDSREGYSTKFARQLVQALRTPGSYGYAFPELGKSINIIYPNDKSFRIFNWAIDPGNGVLKYYGAIQMAGDKLKLYGLADVSGVLAKGLEDSVFTGGHWMGGIYYKIIEEEVNGQKIYTLFGQNASNPLSNRKFLDPLHFTAEGPVFGAPLFNVSSELHPNRRINRFVLEYKKAAQAGLNFDESQKAIYFDKLESEVGDPNRKYTYIPSGQYDGFRWTGNFWSYVPDLIPLQIRADGQAPDAYRIVKLWRIWQIIVSFAPSKNYAGPVAQLDRASASKLTVIGSNPIRITFLQ